MKRPPTYKPCTHAFRFTEQVKRGQNVWVRVTCRDCRKFLGYHPLAVEQGQAKPKKRGRKT